MYLKYMLIEASQSVLIQAGKSVAVVVLCQSKRVEALVQDTVKLGKSSSNQRSCQWKVQE